MPKGRRPRGATPRPRSGAEARRTPCPRSGGQEELPHVRGQGQRPRVPGCDGAGVAERSYPTPKVRGSSQEELPHVGRIRSILIISRVEQCCLQQGPGVGVSKWLRKKLIRGNRPGVP